MKSLFAVALLAAGTVFNAHAAAPTCSTTVESNDAMKFNRAHIDVPKTCKNFTVHLKHTGKLARTVMGHNLVIARTSDIPGVDRDGIAAGAAAHYVKAGDSRVIAHTPLIGGGQSTSVTFPVARLSGGPTSFFCSFPGHSMMMRGTIAVK